METSVALNFVISYLYNKLPRRRVDMFGEELEKGLQGRFDGHWYPDKPFKGSAFRCIRITGDKTDPVMEQAAAMSGLDIEEIKDYLPQDLTLWIDPGEVSYRIGEKGIVKVLYSNRNSRETDIDTFESLDREIQAASRTFNPDAQCFKPIDSLSSSLSNLSVSPSSPTPGAPGWGSVSPSQGQGQSPNQGAPASPTPLTCFLNRPNNTPTFTTAMFAQTKFGSTKLKSQAKRPARLSPTEFGAYIKQRSVLQQPPVVGPHQGPFVPPHIQSPTRPRTLSPREHRDFLEPQPRSGMYLPPAPSSQHGGFSTAHSPQQQPNNTGLLNPLGGSLGDLYLNTPMGLGDMLGNNRMPVAPLNPPSPEGSKAFLEGLSMPTLPPYHNLQHLLVAN
jgi:protein Tob/BTG